MIFDKLLIRIAFLDQQTSHRVQNGQVIAWFGEEMQIGDLIGRSLARINDQDFDIGVFGFMPHNPFENNGMSLGGIGANQMKQFRIFNILISAGRFIQAKTAQVSAYRTGHAETRISFHIIGTDAALEKLIGHIGFLRLRLSGTVECQRIRSIGVTNVIKRGRH